MLPLLATACGQVASQGAEKGCGVDAGQDATPGDGGAGAASVGGSAGVGGTVAGDAATSKCDVAPPPPLNDPTPEEQERAKLIHDFCISVVQQCPKDSLPVWLHAGFGQFQCSAAELVVACEEDTLSGYFDISSVCGAQWKSAVICGTNATYDTGAKCESAGPGLYANISDMPCKLEKDALTACVNANSSWSSVTGTKTTCQYGPSVEAACDVECQVGPNQFSLFCYSPPGLPLLCGCEVNGNFINQDWGGYAGGNFYATDCLDAATRAANGECTNRLDCCFAYNDGKNDVCKCGSDAKLLNMPSCQAAADYAGGQVVDICPQYKFPSGGCWPPPCQ